MNKESVVGPPAYRPKTKITAKIAKVQAQKKRTTLEVRSAAYLKRTGHHVWTCTWWNAWSCRRHDLMGVFDLLAIYPPMKQTIGVQATSASNKSARVKKILASPAAALWCEVGNLILVLAWKKDGKTGRWRASEDWIDRSWFLTPPIYMP